MTMFGIWDVLHLQGSGFQKAFTFYSNKGHIDSLAQSLSFKKVYDRTIFKGRPKRK